MNRSLVGNCFPKNVWTKRADHIEQILRWWVWFSSLRRIKNISCGGIRLDDMDVVDAVSAAYLLLQFHDTRYWNLKALTKCRMWAVDCELTVFDDDLIRSTPDGHRNQEQSHRESCANSDEGETHSRNNVV